MKLWFKKSPVLTGKKNTRTKGIAARMTLAVFLLVMVGGLFYLPAARAEVTSTLPRR